MLTGTSSAAYLGGGGGGHIKWPSVPLQHQSVRCVQSSIKCWKMETQVDARLEKKQAISWVNLLDVVEFHENGLLKAYFQGIQQHPS